MQRACAKLIFNLVLNPGARTQLVKLGIIATLRGLIGDMGDHVLNRYCALCLCVLSQVSLTSELDDLARREVLRTGAFRVIIDDALISEAEFQYVASVTLYNLSWDESTREDLVKQGGLQAIANVCDTQRSAQDVEIAQYLCLALYNLSCAPGLVETVAQPQVLVTLRQLLSFDLCTQYMHRLVAWTLFNLTTCEARASALVESGAVKLCAEIWDERPGSPPKTARRASVGGGLGDALPDERNGAALALCNLLVSRTNTRRIVTDGGCSVLAEYTIAALPPTAANHGLAVAKKEAPSHFLLLVAAWRNLLVQFGNHRSAIEAHCVPALLRLTRNFRGCVEIADNVGAALLCLATSECGRKHVDTAECAEAIAAHDPRANPNPTRLAELAQKSSAGKRLSFIPTNLLLKIEKER